MLVKTVAWLALCLCVCNAERIRILNLDDDDILNDPVARSALKSKIRSLTLKSSIERSSHSNSDNNQPAQKKSDQKKLTTSAASAINDASTISTTTDKYDETPVTPVPVVQPIEGCFRLVPCCCNQTTLPTTPSPYVQPPQPCSGRYPSPIPRLPPGSQQGGQSCSSCCGAAVSLPCYVCPCLSQCSIVPASGCPCQVDQSVEFQCPFAQPQGVPFADLSVWFDQGYRLFETLRAAPDCAYPPAGIPSYPMGAQQWPGSVSQFSPFFGQAKVEQTSQQHQFAALNQGEQQNSQLNPLFRQLRQRPFPSPQRLGGYPGQNYPQSPIPGYQQGPYQPYALPQNGSYQPAPSYPYQTSSSTTTTTEETKSSGVVYVLSSSAVLLSLTGLLSTALLIK